MASLFTFAHRGEAQVFLKREGYKSIPFYFDGLYDNGKDLLLITGEGLQKTTEKVAAVCAFYRNKISQIVNLGIAGSLSSELVLGEIYSVRTVYREDEFNSFTTHRDLSHAEGRSPEASPSGFLARCARNDSFDCISALDRVVTDEKAAKLGCFAQIVDRELWAIGSCAALFKIPFQSYKLISDRAGSQTRCFDLRERALSFSEKIYNYFSKCGSKDFHYKKDEGGRYFLERASATLPRAQEIVLPPIQLGVKKVKIPEGFYATTSQSQKLENLSKKLVLKWHIKPEQVFERLDLETLKKEEKHPKKRTTRLLMLLERSLMMAQHFS